MITKRNVTEMETYTGRYVDLLEPNPADIKLADIAVGLSNVCRFGGQVSRSYSVAEHSVRVMEQVEPALWLPALLHDAHEAYTNDIIAPMKYVLELEAPGVVKGLQERLDRAIAEAADFPYEILHSPQIKLADDYIMYREAATLKYSHGLGDHWGNGLYHEPLIDCGWSQPDAERRFLEAFEKCCAKPWSSFKL